MVFSDTTNETGIVQEVLKITKSTVGKYALKDIARRVNLGMDRYFSIGHKVAGIKVDDVNRSSAPIGTQTITSGTNNYKIASFSGSASNFLKLEILDGSSNSHQLSEDSLIEINFNEAYSSSITGIPTYFTRLGDFIYLRPTPNYTLAAALKAFIERPPYYVLSTDTVREPGIPSDFHGYLCKFAAQPYLEENGMDNVKSNYQHILEDEKEIKDYFSRIRQGVGNRLNQMYQNNR